MSVKIVFAGGGTGGHIYPGLAVADELKNLAKENGEDIKIYWFGNTGALDKTIVKNSGTADFFLSIPSGKLRRYFSLKNVFDLFKIFAGFCVSFVKLFFIRPALLFSKGGFVSVTPCIAAKLLRIPVLTHECDFTPGLATKINSRFATSVLLSYKETVNFLPKKIQAKTMITGNPVRPSFYTASAQNGRQFLFEESEGQDMERAKPMLLVLGGSLGAHQLNSLVVENLDWLTEHFLVVHQCGSKDKDFVPKKSKNYRPYSFIYNQMPDVIACADIVLSRAGANTLWELAVLGKPSVLVPLCGSGTRGDQIDNARFFEKNGCALVLEGDEANAQNLKTALEKLSDAEIRKDMTIKALLLSSGERPAKKIAQLIFKNI